ncbi:hypothetical protein [Rhodohalobacter sp. 8-1]|uniref:hypothetical protein n=1 Tax=Rhodohalobacter sp. 8-1 TaxID=3131972 RepID=UPI0030ED1BDF
MKRHIRIGYIGRNKSWEQVLGQIGASWDRVNPGRPIPFEDYSCIIVDRSMNRAEYTHVSNYLQKEGAIIDTTGTFCSSSVQRQFISTITPNPEDPLFGHIDEVPVHCVSYSIDSSARLNGTVWFDPSPGRNMAFCGLPIDQLWSEFKTAHRPFGSTTTALTAERISQRQSRPYVDVVLTLLRALHDKSGLPFVHKWWHPDSNKLAATCRIDSDYAPLDTIKLLSDSARELDIPLSWFLHTSHHEPHLKDLIELLPDTDEVALHCYRHYEYSTSEQYRSDIHEGLRLLNTYGVWPAGYAAPYGCWSKPLADALTSFSFEYTSEFGYDFDSLPSTAHASGILQLPVHPVSIGSFSRFMADQSHIQSYFQQVADKKYLTHLPLHLYHHPNDCEPVRFADLLKLFDRDNYHWMTYSDWSNWWNKRVSKAINVRYDTKTGQLHLTKSSTGSIPIAIHQHSGLHVTVSDEPTLQLEELPFRPYIDPELKSIAEKRINESGLSWFRLKKDQWLTHLWRNRA